MFFGCNNITNLNLSSFNTKNVTNMSYMFSWCNNITNLNLSSFDTKFVIDMNKMFFFSDKLVYVKIKKKNNGKLLYELNKNVKIEE